MDDLSSRSNIKSILALMMVIWHSGSEISIFKGPHCLMVNGAVIPTGLALSCKGDLGSTSLQRRWPSFKVFCPWMVALN